MSSYSELIKNFENIRSFMRDFYVYGFKSRSDFDSKSLRSYDNERRRVESWLSDYMRFAKDSEGKRVFISVDSLSVSANPLYNAFKTKSFTNGDIVFHFYILDMLSDGKKLSVSQIMDSFADDYFSCFDDDFCLDESTVRKKLREYVKAELLVTQKRGKELLYSRKETEVSFGSFKEAVEFFSEENPIGVIGSFILDKFSDNSDIFRHKHHYILHAIDSGVLYSVLDAMSEDRNIEVTVRSVKKDKEITSEVFPVKILVSTQTGRQYLLCKHLKFLKLMLMRIDSIVKVKPLDICRNAVAYREDFNSVKNYMWGASLGNFDNTHHIEMTIHIEENEGYIINRLYREKRCGKVTQLDRSTYLFTADVFDATELLPWIRSFMGRVQSLSCTDESVVNTFYSDIAEMNRLYGGG
mgnify:CR=1 FL=1